MKEKFIFIACIVFTALVIYGCSEESVAKLRQNYEYEYEKGYDAGYDTGYETGYEEGQIEGTYAEGFSDGYYYATEDHTYERGYEDGYDQGYSNALIDYLTLDEFVSALRSKGLLTHSLAMIIIKNFENERYVLGGYYIQDNLVHRWNCDDIDPLNNSLKYGYDDIPDGYAIHDCKDSIPSDLLELIYEDIE